MHWLDWTVMGITIGIIIVYGVYHTRHIRTAQAFLQGDKSLSWWTIGLSIMATQASAITFLSTPGQAFDDGMRFAQFYFGLPIAMIILSIFVLPIYYKLNVYTAYEYLERRFDLRVRTFTAFLFLIARGLAAGITIYAPSIILSSLMGWDLTLTNLVMALTVVLYTVSGGTKAVSVTQQQQMIVILAGMFIAAVILLYKLPPHVGLHESTLLAGQAGKLNVVDFSFDLSNRYTFWSGILGGVFLFLSYFGTDQSQVQRYLSGKSLTESRLGLLFNGIIKVPMQFLILFVGVLVYVFYIYNPSPIHFNRENITGLEKAGQAEAIALLESEHHTTWQNKQATADALLEALANDDQSRVEEHKQQFLALQQEERQHRAAFRELVKTHVKDADTNDKDYVFVAFVTKHLPIGLIGLILAVIFSAAMSSISSELNALATTSVVDIYKRSLVRNASDGHYLLASRMFTIFWGLVAFSFAATASLFENLIQAVNIIGSLFYGTILGVFLTAFFIKKAGSSATFLAAIIGEILVILLFFLDRYEYISIAFLWLNLIGCAIVVGMAIILQFLFSQPGQQQV